MPASRPPGLVLPIALAIVVVVIAGIVMRVLSEGALVEGVERARRGRIQTIKDGFRRGWAHLGTIFLIKVIYIVASVASAILLALPCIASAPLIGIFRAIVILGIPAVVIAVPWLVTLYIWQAFAVRVAVLESRHSADAIRKARLFMHGRLLHGLKLLVAALLGTLLVGIVGVIVVVPLALLVAGSFALGGVVAAVALGLLLLVPAATLLVAIIGTFQSSVWTIGYLAEVQA